MPIFGEAPDPEKARYQREWFEWCESENLTGLDMALAEGQDIHEIVIDGLTAASIAALGDRLRLFEFLREHGADFTKPDGHGRNALMCAAQAGSDRIAKKLLTRGAPETFLAARDPQGRTALHYAAHKGQFAMVELLLSRGADASAVDNDRRGVLHYAVQSSSPATVLALLAAGCDPEQEDAKGLTPAKTPGSTAACREALSSSPSSHGPSGFGSFSI